MRKGDLVEMDMPGQRVHGKIGIVVDRVRQLHEWMRDRPKLFAYDVLVDGQVWRCTYENLLEQECLQGDEEG